MSCEGFDLIKLTLASVVALERVGCWHEPYESEAASAWAALARRKRRTP